MSGDTETALTIPGFPEVVAWKARCRLCALSSRAPELLRQIHTFYRRGYDARRLALETADLWRKRQEAVITQRMFEKHFEEHVDFSDLVQEVAGVIDVTTEARVLGDGRSFDLDMPDGSPAKARRSEGARLKAKLKPDSDENMADQAAESDAEMRAIIKRLQTRMEEVDDTATFVDEETNQVVKATVEAWLKLVGETRQCLETLHRMRNNERFMKAILQSYARRHTQLVSAPLVARFQELLEELRASDVPERLLISAENLMKGEVRDILLHAAEESVRESVEAYRLH